MGNKEIFQALSSPTRIKILKLLSIKEMHLTGLAKEIQISKPVTSKHIKKLEEAGLVKRRIIGNVHLLKSNIKNLEKTLESFTTESEVSVNKNESLFDALEQIPTIEVKKIGKDRYIKSIDGEKGYFIYEIDGKIPEKPINEYIINKDVSVDLKKILTVKKKNLKITIKR